MNPVSQSKLQKALLIVLAVVCLLVSSFSQGRLNRTRDKLGLTRVEALKNAPPLLVFTTVVLGGFRGIIANALWIRAIEMQDNGQYFEMVQLADWITKLTPHIANVWVVAAWNMSYNISVKFSEPEDRWRWVQRGIELLRDEALKYNPHEVELYRELGWHFQHKLGHNLDDAHLFYKASWAREMQDVLGSGHPDFDAFINPQTDEMKERARELRTVYKLDPAIMKETDERYGPLEWRLPETHAIYWAVVGRKEAKTDDQLIKLRRLIYQSMQMAFHRGRFVGLEKTGRIEFGQNLDIVDKTNAAYEEMIAEDKQLSEHIGKAHRNFLRDAVYFLYVHARVSEAQKWLAYLKQKYPDMAPKGSLEDYALSKVEEDAGETDMNKTISNINGYITQSFYYLAVDEDDIAAGNMLMAKNFWNRYMGKIQDGPSAERVGLPPIETMRDKVLQEVLDPEEGFVPELAALLRSKLGLPAAPPPNTNAPPATATPPPPAGPAGG